ncbi:MAG: ferredoxin [Thermoleophilia bacterium]|nr:ferredoxin [Thermoleophilia bacterium]
MTTYQIQLDESLCSGMGDCVRLAPDVIELAPDGIARLITGTTDDPGAVAACKACPMAALAAWRADTGERVA